MITINDLKIKPVRKISFLRLGVLLLIASLGTGLGYTVKPPEIQLVEPKEDELVVLNGCVVSACSYLASVRAQHKLEESFWSRVMLVRYQNNTAGHAYCVWQTDGHIFGYDRAGGSFPIPGNLRDPVAIASSLAGGIEKVTKQSMIVAHAEFIEPKTSRIRAF